MLWEKYSSKDPIQNKVVSLLKYKSLGRVASEWTASISDLACGMLSACQCQLYGANVKQDTQHVTQTIEEHMQTACKCKNIMSFWHFRESLCHKCRVHVSARVTCGLRECALVWRGLKTTMTHRPETMLKAKIWERSHDPNELHSWPNVLLSNPSLQTDETTQQANGALLPEKI